MLDSFFPAITKRLNETDFSVSSASGTHAELPGWTRLEGFSQRPSAGFPVGVRSVRRWSRALGHDVILTNTATASAIVRSAGLGIPVIYFCHGLHWADDSAVSGLPWQLVEKAMLGRTAAVITMNRDDERWFCQRTGKPVHRLRFGVGVPLDEFPASPVPQEDLDLLWVGNFNARKRPMQAVEVVRHLRDLGCPVRLRMVGDGPLHPAVTREIDARNLGSVIRADGRGDVPAALRSATALLHTATWEGLPRVALEAAAVGRWCYGYDTKGFRDAPLGRLAAEGDTPGLARMIMEDHRAGAMHAVPDLRHELSSTSAADAIGDIILETLRRTGSGPRVTTADPPDRAASPGHAQAQVATSSPLRTARPTRHFLPFR